MISTKRCVIISIMFFKKGNNSEMIQVISASNCLWPAILLGSKTNLSSLIGPDPVSNIVFHICATGKSLPFQEPVFSSVEQEG